MLCPVLEGLIFKLNQEIATGILLGDSALDLQELRLQLQLEHANKQSTDRRAMAAFAVAFSLTQDSRGAVMATSTSSRLGSYQYPAQPVVQLKRAIEVLHLGYEGTLVSDVELDLEGNLLGSVAMDRAQNKQHRDGYSEAIDIGNGVQRCLRSNTIRVEELRAIGTTLGRVLEIYRVWFENRLHIVKEIMSHG